MIESSCGENPSRELSHRLFLFSYMLIAITFPISEGLFQAAVAINFVLIIIYIKRWRDTFGVFLSSQIGLTIFLVLLWWIITTFLGKYTPSYSRVISSILSVFALFSGICFFSIINNRNENLNFRKNIIIAFAVSSFLCMSAGYCQLFFGTFPFEELFIPKNRSYIPQLYIPGHYLESKAISGFFSNRLKMAFFLIIPFSLLFPLVFYKNTSKQLKIIMSSILFFLMMTQVFTYSRSAFIAMCFTFFVGIFFLVKTKQKYLFLIMSLFCFILISIFSSSVRERFLSLLTSGFFTDRFFIWKTCKEIFFDFPIAGTGFGSFFSASNEYYVSLIPKHSPWRTSCHNDSVTFAVTTGVIGLLLWCMFLAQIFKMIIHVFKNAMFYISSQNFLVISSAMILLSLLIQSLVHEMLFYPMTNILFWFFCGVLIHVNGFYKNSFLKK